VTRGEQFRAPSGRLAQRHAGDLSNGPPACLRWEPLFRGGSRRSMMPGVTTPGRCYYTRPYRW